MRLLLALIAATAAAAAPASPASAEFTSEGANDGWIVVLKNDAPRGASLHMRDMAAAAGSVPRQTFDFGPGLLRGHVMAGPGSETAVQHMASSPYVSNCPRFHQEGIVLRPTALSKNTNRTFVST